MKITKSVVQKMTITDLKNLDTVAVFVEDFHPGAGKITIACYGDCWTYYWSHMGEQHTLASFFVNCDEHYLAGKLKSGINSEIHDTDWDVCDVHLRKDILRQRREGDISREKARALWELVDDSVTFDGEINRDIFYEVFGDDWYEYLPNKPNPDYVYLCRVIKTVQEALAVELK